MRKNHNGFSKGTVEQRKLHNIYTHMVNKGHYKYRTYRCKEWEENPISFYNWAYSTGYLEHIKKYGFKNTTLDRINVNNHFYSPSNCRWATLKTQSNNKTNNIYVKYKEKTMTLKQWCEYLNINYQKVWCRIKYLNWTPLQALELEKKERWKNAT